MTVDRDTELWREPEQREKAGGKAVLFLLLVLAALAGGAYVAAYLAAGDKVPRGTTVAGVAVGGHTQDDAVALLERELATDGRHADRRDRRRPQSRRGARDRRPVRRLRGLDRGGGAAAQLVARVALGLLHRGRRPRRGGDRRRAHPGGVPHRARRRGRATRPRGCGRSRLRPRQGHPAPRRAPPSTPTPPARPSTRRSWSTRRTGRRCPSRWCRCRPRSTTPTSAAAVDDLRQPGDVGARGADLRRRRGCGSRRPSTPTPSRSSRRTARWCRSSTPPGSTRWSPARSPAAAPRSTPRCAWSTGSPRSCRPGPA